MLRILHIDNADDICQKTKTELFRDNPVFLLTIKAPLYWWLDSEVVSIERSRFVLPVTERVSIQTMPLKTLAEGILTLPYQKMIELCENFLSGEYEYHRAFNEWDNEEEWREFCEELMNIKGVKSFCRR